eukprot:Phypoly_transcript_06206.p1 GENE.Phypoly_transcript_06206~~Phypoly_transcript_06206.p1  ORF type:complete len:600 (+),score=160.61 Phypoly_transcript_06206:127-1800(+)
MGGKSMKKASALPPKRTYKPPAKLKQLFWVKLNDAAIPKAPIWTQITNREEMPINTTELDALFSAAASKVAAPGAGGTEKKEAPKVVYLLDLKKGNNIAIGLSRVKKSGKEIAEAILHATSDLNTEQLEFLAKYIPTPDEMVLIHEHEDKSTLGVAEKYYLEVEPVPNLGRKIKALLLRDQFSVRIGKLTEDIVVVTSAATQIVKSQSLQRILEAILAIGNYLNAGTRLAPAYGFKLDAIKKVTDTRANGKNINLLHYIITVVERADPSINQFVEELNMVPKAKAAPLQTLETDLKALEVDVNGLQAEMQSEDEDSASFRTAFKPFALSAQLEVGNTKQKYTEMGDALKKMFEYFGDDVKQAEKMEAVEEFFQMIVGFIQQFDKSEKDLAKEKAAAAKAAAKPAASAKQAPKAAIKMEQPHEEIVHEKEHEKPKDDEWKGVLDSLFSAIKSGKIYSTENGTEVPLSDNKTTVAKASWKHLVMATAKNHSPPAGNNIHTHPKPSPPKSSALKPSPFASAAPSVSGLKHVGLKKGAAHVLPPVSDGKPVFPKLKHVAHK